MMRNGYENQISVDLSESVQAKPSRMFYLAFVRMPVMSSLMTMGWRPINTPNYCPKDSPAIAYARPTRAYILTRVKRQGPIHKVRVTRRHTYYLSSSSSYTKYEAERPGRRLVRARLLLPLSCLGGSTEASFDESACSSGVLGVLGGGGGPGSYSGFLGNHSLR